MKVVIRMSAREEAKALPILLRHSPGTILSERTYILADAAVQSLRKAGIRFTEISRDSAACTAGERLVGERI